MKFLFTDCWVGCYVGEGEYEGGCCPDLLITNVPDDMNTEDIFDMYLRCLCNGFDGHDKKEYFTQVVKRRSKTWNPTKIDSLNDLINCSEEFIEVDFNDLTNWLDEDEDED